MKTEGLKQYIETRLCQSAYETDEECEEFRISIRYRLSEVVPADSSDLFVPKKSVMGMNIAERKSRYRARTIHITGASKNKLASNMSVRVTDSAAKRVTQAHR